MAKYIIVGGVAGGATAAARLRRLSEEAEIILIERGPYISYANCGLPYHVGGTIAERSNLLLQTPESFSARYRVDVRVQEEVVGIDPKAQTVQIRTAEGRTYSETYDKLLLSPGASPIRPQIEGIDEQGVFTLRSVEDMDAIKTFIHERGVRRAIVVGGGFIGLEMAENLHDLGISTSIVELAPQVMAPVDYSIASLVHAHLVQQGIGLYLGHGLQAIRPSTTDSGLTLSLSGDLTLEADLVLLSIGVAPNSTLARMAGLELGVRGGIVVNSRLQTSDPNIYAVGDAIEYPHPLTGKPWHNYLAGPANRQARIVAGNMLGATDTYEGSIGTAIAKVFDLTVGTTGLPAKALQASGLPYRSVTIHPMSHAGYYPGATPMTLKITFDPEHGRLYGAQAVGGEGVDKRIDSIAQLIKQGLGISALIETEHAYAPPYSSAKDPIAMAGYVAENILLGKVLPAYWREVGQDASEQIIDVRTPGEYQLGHIPSAVNIPVDELRERLEEIDPSRPILLYCAVGLRGYLASSILRQHGYAQVRNLIGGYKLWSSATRDYSHPIPPKAPTISGGSCPQTSEHDVHEGIETIDASGQCCPGPIMTLKRAVDELAIGGQVRVVSTDPGFLGDCESWCASTGHRLAESHREAGRYEVVVERAEPSHAGVPSTSSQGPRGKSFILFSDDLDKALATFVLANGAAATGSKVSIFFTFWGLNAIKRSGASPQKDIWGRLFSMMLPCDSRGLGLSKMNMLGLGPWMMRKVMKVRGVDSLETLRQQAIDNGVEFIACQMSMDVMGIHREELLPNVSIGGVATYMNRAEQSSVNLFI